MHAPAQNGNQKLDFFYFLWYIGATNGQKRLNIFIQKYIYSKIYLRLLSFNRLIFLVYYEENLPVLRAY